MPPAVAEPTVRRPRADRRSTPAAVSAAGRPLGVRAASAERVVFAGADWAFYRRLRDAPENAGRRITYDGPAGLLEIEVAESFLHASVSRLLYTMVFAFAAERGVRLHPAGSLTVAREDVDRGCEPDESFYVTNVDRRPTGPGVLDLAGGDLPPDLVIEVDVTNPGVAKLPVYAALGVPEVWAWRAETLTARRLTSAGAYETVSDSGELPGFPFDRVAELVADRDRRAATELQAAFAEHLRAE